MLPSLAKNAKIGHNDIVSFGLSQDEETTKGDSVSLAILPRPVLSKSSEEEHIELGNTLSMLSISGVCKTISTDNFESSTGIRNFAAHLMICFLKGLFCLSFPDGHVADGAMISVSLRSSFSASPLALSAECFVSCTEHLHVKQQSRHGGNVSGRNKFVGGMAAILFALISAVAQRIASAFDWLLSRSPAGPSTVAKIFFARRKVLLMGAVLGACLPHAAAAPVTVNLLSFRSGAGLRITGASEYSQTGTTAAAIGDHNGDGRQDFLYSSFTQFKMVIVMGKNAPYVPTTTESIVSGQFYRVITGPANSQVGTSVGGIGDINDDGFDDVIIGAYRGEVVGRGGAGFAVVIFGAAGPFTNLVVNSTWAASTPSLGFTILGTNINNALGATSRSARGLGDVNGDGVDDFAISNRYSPGTTSLFRPGVVYVIFGRKSTAFTTIDTLPANFGGNGITYTGAVADDRLGFAVMPAGDFNSDGIADFMMSSVDMSPTVNGTTRAAAGVVFLIYGSKTSLVSMDISTFVTGSKGVRIVGGAASDNLGGFVAGVGDINDDGIDDIAVGAYNADPPTSPARLNAGIVYVIYGTTLVFTADVDLNNFNSFDKGFAIYGSMADYRLATVSPAGDINQDGVDDIVVGSVSSNGDVTIVYGQREARTSHVDINTASVTTFLYSDYAYMGNNLDGGKDLNGDGIPDLLVCANLATVTPESGGVPMDSAGAVWVLPGPFQAATDSPSKRPTNSPFRVPTARPTRNPSAVPSRKPSVSPSVVSSVRPTAVDPTMKPTMTPSVDPSVNPSLSPSAAPAFVPSVNPSVNPSLSPSVAPVFVPSADPSVNPSLSPSVAPSFVPSAVPSMDHSVTPSAVPSVALSADPSVGSSGNPSAAPSLAPSVIPTVMPSFVPSAVPSVSPTFSPSNAPSVVVTVVPTAVPTFAPSGAPSAVPTIRPTNAADADSELIVDVEQEAYFIEKAKYDAQQSAYNKTIQHTVSEAIGGVIPERVTDIVVEEEEEEEEEEGGRSNFRNGVVVSSAATARPVVLKYTITVHDPMYTMDMLRVELVRAAQEGRMDSALRFYAAQFGATGLNNATLAVPQVTNAVVQRDSSSQLTGLHIALLVIGIVMALCLIAVGVWWRRTKPTQTIVLPVEQNDVVEVDA